MNAMNDTQIRTLIVGGTPSLAIGIAKPLERNGQDVIFGVAPAQVKAMQSAAVVQDVIPLTLDNPDALGEELVALPVFQTLVINPGWFSARFFLDETNNDIQQALKANFEEAVYVAQGGAKRMIANGTKGRIIFVTSVSMVMPFVRASLYGTSLAPLESITKMAAHDLGPHGITVNMIAPGWTATEEGPPHPTEEGREHIERGTPTGRMTQPEDIGALCLFLSSHQAAHLTGTIIPLDGGFSLTRSDGSSPYVPEEAN